MSEIIVSTQVSASQEHVFKIFTEIDKAAERIPAITELVMLSEGPFGEGTRWRETRVIMKKEATEEMWVTDFDPPRSYRVDAESHGMKYSTLFTFEPNGDQVTVTWRFNGTALTLGAKIMAPIFNLLMGGVMRRCMLEDLEALRDVSQQEGNGAGQ